MDNFSIIYKQLLFSLIVAAVAGVISTLCIYPFIRDLINSNQLNELIEGATGFLQNLLNGDVSELGQFSQKVQQAYTDFIALLQTKSTQFILSLLLLILVHAVSKWFTGIANYAAASLINDRMALRAKQPFLGTMISTLKQSTVYNAMYVPLSILYDLAVGVAMFFLLFFLLSSVIPFLISVFLFILIIVISVVIKMTFTSDWLPALIRGKKGHLGAFAYSFAQKGKKPLSVASNFTVLVLLIFAINSAALFLTFGVGLLITIPSSYVILICFEFVNYYDREGIKYFLDDNTIVCTAKEQPMTRESFFRGE